MKINNVMREAVSSVVVEADNIRILYIEYRDIGRERGIK